MAGTVGAIFNGALQLGSAVGIAAVSSIQTSVERKNGGSSGYAGRAAAWWFLVGVVVVEAIAVAVFYRRGPAPEPNPAEEAASDDKHADEEKVAISVPELEGPTPQVSEFMVHSMTASEVTLAGPHDAPKRPKPPNHEFSSYTTVVNA